MDLIRSKTIAFKSLLLIVTLVGIVSAQGSGGEDPAPLKIEADSPADSPLHLELYSVDTSGKSFQVINYLGSESQPEENTIVCSCPWQVETTSFFRNAFVPGEVTQMKSRVEQIDVVRHDKFDMSIDYVLFEDGTSWGKDETGESNRVSGFWDAHRDVVLKARALLDKNDTKSLSEWLNTEVTDEILPADNDKKNYKWQQGYKQGYRQMISILRSDLETYGNETVSKGLTTMENFLGVK